MVAVLEMETVLVLAYCDKYRGQSTAISGNCWFGVDLECRNSVVLQFVRMQASVACIVVTHSSLTSTSLSSHLEK